jgi:hypothetical protein
MTNAEAPETTREAFLPSAVAWIDERRAFVAEIDQAGQMTTCSIERGGISVLSYLALVVDAIGDQERVLILGPGDVRLELEREYVSIYHRPDRLVDVEPAGAIGTMDLARRLRELAS